MKRGNSEKDAGSSTAEAVIIIPILTILILLMVQLALWGYAEEVVQAAAVAGNESARAYNGSVTASKDQVMQVASNSGSNTVEVKSVQIERQPSMVKVVVTGQCISILPFVNFPVSAVSVAPLQYFRPQQ